MSEIIYILKILFYLFIVFLLYRLSHDKNKFTIDNAKSTQCENRNEKWIFSLGAILLLCLLLGYYSTICGCDPEMIDRGRYAHRFTHNIYEEKKNSLGLFYIEYVLIQFTSNPYVLFFVMAFISTFITLIAYNQFELSNPRCLLYLGFTQYFFFSFYQLKQSPAIALGALSLAFLFKNKKVISIAILVLAITFHEASFILIPLYVLLLGKKKRWVWVAEIIVLLVTTVGFSFVTRGIVQLANLIPGVGIQMSSYVNESGSINVNTHFATAIKGIPLYFITYTGIRKRKELLDLIPNYDRFLILSIFACFTTILSIYNYWMWRLGSFCYFPVCVFASQIVTKTNNAKDKKQIHYVFLLSYAFFTIRVMCQYYFKYGGFV